MIIASRPILAQVYSLLIQVHAPAQKCLQVCRSEVKWTEVIQSCLTLCDPMDCSLQGSSIHGIFQARVLEWVAISFSRGLPDPGIEPRSPALQADTLLSEPPGESKNVEETANSL